MPSIDFSDDEIRALTNILATKDIPWIVSNPLLAKLSQAQQRGNSHGDIDKDRGAADSDDYDKAAAAVIRHEAKRAAKG